MNKISPEFSFEFVADFFLIYLLNSLSENSDIELSGCSLKFCSGSEAIGRS